MARAAHERLSAQDRAFLVFEDADAHMHLGGIALFEAAPLRAPGGGIDIERLRAHIASRLHLVPRYRQRLAWVPVLERPVWVDDDHFNLAYHVRHTAVPRPGDDEQLKRLAARVLSQQLDRGKPLWELWVVEGLHGDRFAVLVKVHHALADGISAFGLFSALLSPVPTDTVDRPVPWTPRPAPPPLALLRHEVLQQASAPLRLACEMAAALRRPAELGETARDALRALWDLAGAGLGPPARTPLNQPIGAHRRFDWLASDLETVRAIRRRSGGTVNDVVLATVAGAVRRFLERRGAAVHGLAYRVVVPVNVRAESERGAVNNRVSGWLATLPVGEPDPLRRLAAVQATTARLKAAKQALGPEMLGRAVEYALPGVLTLGVRLAARLHPYNLIVSNVPGPPIPLYMLGARLLAGYPQVPLFENQGLGVALFSYCGALCWGFNADWDVVPDLADFVADVAASFDELAEAAGAAAPAGTAAAR
jgi:diacylglycerol O-acyltransferase